MIEINRTKKNTTKRIVVTYFTNFGMPKIGANVSVRVVRASDGQYLQSNGSWATTPQADPTAVEWSSANSPGIYYFDFQLPDAVDFYVIAFDGGSGSGVPQRYQYLSLEAVAVDEDDLRKAVAILANRQEQDIATGVVTVMDDDGVTPLFTLTPSVDDVNNPTKNILTVSNA